MLKPGMHTIWKNKQCILISSVHTIQILHYTQDFMILAIVIITCADKLETVRQQGIDRQKLNPGLSPIALLSPRDVSVVRLCFSWIFLCFLSTEKNLMPSAGLVVFSRSSSDNPLTQKEVRVESFNPERGQVTEISTNHKVSLNITVKAWNFFKIYLSLIAAALDSQHQRKGMLIRDTIKTNLYSTQVTQRPLSVNPQEL